jgi:MtrB/PioB family decaheme-associated outer membrane protein
MKKQNNLVRTFLFAAVLGGAGLVSSGALAQDCCLGGSATGANAWNDGLDTSAEWPPLAPPAGAAPLIGKAVAAPVPYWWYHGEVEVGGRFFLNNPRKDGLNYLRQDSLAKYYEYKTIAPGAFGGGHFQAGSSDGLYGVDFWANNAGSWLPVDNVANLRGFSDQAYLLDLSKIGEQYLTLQWDETPHVYSTGAETFFQGVGTTSLTLPPGFPLIPTPAAIPGTIAPFLYKFDLGIQRDTASVDYRWTPEDAWDIRADYSHLHRTGTLVDGVVGPTSQNTFPYGPTQVARPVDDTTQNYGVNGEYQGTSPWNQRYTFKAAYNGSQYDDAFSSYTIQNPFVPPAGSSPIDRESTFPSNRADAVGGTLAADLPWNSRYVGTLNYNMMRQNEAFIPMTAFPGAAVTPWTTLPASSLNGAINTLLSNNVLTTKITPELTSKARYRYYNFDNDTPEILFPFGYTGVDQNPLGPGEFAHDFPGGISSLSMGYIKQNAGEELNWRPTRAWNLGAAYEYERYDWTRADANATNENGGKVWADWQPTSWFNIRSSGSYSQRRYENYDYYTYVGNIQYNENLFAFPVVPGAPDGYSEAYRQFFLDNRDRTKANIEANIVVVPGLTLTPNFKYQEDYYGLNPLTEEGLTDDRGWSAGADATYAVNPRATITVGYLREYISEELYNCSCGGHLQNGALPINNPTKFIDVTDHTPVDTFTAAARVAAIPDKLDLTLRYAASHAVDHQRLSGPGAPATAATTAFPDVTTWFQRLDAAAIYTFDKETVARLGWKGDIKAKLHYAWERNAVTDWQIDTVAPYNALFATGANAIFMAYDNPNYNVHMLMASLQFAW